MKTETNNGDIINTNLRLIILDSLRGVAALIVCYHHLFKICNEYFRQTFHGISYDVLNFISDLNHVAVIFFFVLSGFSIGLSIRNKNITHAEGINDFLYRRFKRILPLYWIAIALTIICGAIMFQLAIPDYSIKNLLGNLIFMQTSASLPESWFVPYGLNGPFWSLSYEFFFYCFFPIVYLINEKYLLKVNINIKFLILLLLSIVAFAFNKFFYIPHVAFFTSFIIWLLGFMNAKAYLYGKSYNLLFIGSALFSLGYFFIGQRLVSSSTLTVICQGLLISSIFYLFVKIYDNTILIRITKTPVKMINGLFYHIGKGSYALYAFHYPILLVFKYYSLHVSVQLLGLSLLIVACIYIEEWSITKKNYWLKQNYSSFVLSKLSFIQVK